MEVLKQLRVIALDVIKREELGISVLGPAEAPLAKLKTRWRSHLLLKSKTARDLLVVRANLQRAKIRTKKVRVVYDIDPQDML